MDSLLHDERGKFRKGNKGGPGRPNLVKELTDYGLTVGLPKTENEVRERFRILNEVLGLAEVLISQDGFPDFLLKTRGGNLLRAEVEIKSSHFRTHGHESEDCDLIICWLDNWPHCPLPTFAIQQLWSAYEHCRGTGLLVLPGGVNLASHE